MVKAKIRKTLRFILLCFAAGIGTAAVVALVLQFRIRLSNDWQQYAELDRVEPPTSKASVVVFAPHCDDETLGCGGVLALAVRNKARVRVVLITNGDGYRLAVSREYKTIRVTPSKCIEFAYHRQAETLKALSVLGVPASRVTFLGYPDRGLARLWNTHWDSSDPYFSKATGTDHSPYRNSFTPDAAYCGQSLIQDIQTILEQSAPTDVWVPHPLDNHSDHYATYCFVSAALEQLGSKDWRPGRKLRVHTYLVHRGDWPTPRGNRPGEHLVPPCALAGSSTKWSALELPQDIVEKKQQAIKCYRSQLAIEPAFLMSFARLNDLIGNIPLRKVVRVPNGTISVDGSPMDWAGITPCVIDPVKDYVMANVNKGGDVRSIYLCADQQRLFIRVDCVGKLSKATSYALGFRGIGRLGVSDRCTVTFRPPGRCTHPTAAAACRGNVMEMSLPRSEFSFADRIFVQVTTKIARLTVDNTGWQAVQFSRQ